MYHFKDLEDIIKIPIRITKNDKYLFNKDKSIKDYVHDFQPYTIYSKAPLSNKHIELIKVILKHNENIKPLWQRVLFHEGYQIQEIPGAYLDEQKKSIWLIKGHQIFKDLDLIQATLEISEVTVIHKHLLAIIMLASEEINPDQLSDQIETETFKNVRIIVGPSVNHIDDLAISYDYALGLEKINASNKKVLHFKDILLPQIIGCADKEALSRLSDLYFDLYPIQSLTDELVETIYSFLKNNLNVTDTANDLYLHRNTLIYRLNKIHQVTNLDIRNFEDANKMKVLLHIKVNHLE